MRKTKSPEQRKQHLLLYIIISAACEPNRIRTSSASLPPTQRRPCHSFPLLLQQTPLERTRRPGPCAKCSKERESPTNLDARQVRGRAMSKLPPARIDPAIARGPEDREVRQSWGSTLHPLTTWLTFHPESGRPSQSAWIEGIVSRAIYTTLQVPVDDGPHTARQNGCARSVEECSAQTSRALPSTTTRGKRADICRHRRNSVIVGSGQRSDSTSSRLDCWSAWSRAPFRSGHGFGLFLVGRVASRRAVMPSFRGALVFSHY